MSTTIPMADNRQFRNALGAFATGVTIVTTRDSSGLDVGLTASSFNSVSLDPPMILWSLAKTSGSLPAFMEGEHFAVHILSAEQQPLSDRFSKRGIDKFENVQISRGPADIPLLNDCSARFVCRMTHRYEGGDHMIFVGEVIDFDHSGHAPLAFHGGKYAKVFPRAVEAQVEEDSGSFGKDYLVQLAGLAAIQLYRPVQRGWRELGLSECGYFLLSVLAAGKHRTWPEIEPLISLSGRSLGPDELDALVVSGLVIISEANGCRQFDLTEKGREYAVKLSVLAKSSEQKAIHDLDWDDLALLKRLLKQVIRNTRSS